MKYVLTTAPSTEAVKAMMENSEAVVKEITQLIDQIKPEAIYFSTIRRLFIIVANIEDPHVEARNVFEALSKFGEVTIDPVSTMEEFSRYLKQL